MSPEDIAAIRPLIRWARDNGYHHATYQINKLSPVEHNWRTQGRSHEVAVWDGVLVYDRDGVRRITAHLDNAQQAGRLLGVYGIGGVS